MNETHIGKRIVVIISEHRGETETATGTISRIIDENIFEIVDRNGIPSVWNIQNIRGYKFKGDY